MAPPSLTCSRCSSRIPVPAPVPHAVFACDKCPALLDTVVFPALFRTPEAGRAGERLVFDTESSCFNHPGKRAEVACEGCGRFLCALCDVTYHGRHLCPACIAVGGVVATPQTRLVHYDTIALAVFLLGNLLSLFTCGLASLLAAPYTLYLVVRHWNTPMSIMPRSRWRFVVAGGLALAQVAAMFVSIFLAILG